MKVYVYRDNEGEKREFFSQENAQQFEEHYNCRLSLVGTVELSIDPPKKIVQKEATMVQWERCNYFEDKLISRDAAFRIPDGAKNIKCTYDIES